MSVNIAHDVDLVPRTEDVLSEKCSFEELGLNTNLLKALHDCGFQTPSPIQYRAIPIGLCGFDLVLQAKSGTGKTLVFGVICLESIQTKTSDLQALILSPTREIAVQTQQLLSQIGGIIGNIKAEVFIGGLPIEEDRQKLLGCQIAVGAPGRIKHLLVKRVLNPNKIKLLILDEADQLICRNFLQDVKYIYSCLPNKKQVIAASATYSSEFSKFMKIFMKYPSIITPKFEIPTLLGIKQFVSIVNNELGDGCVIETLTNLFSQIVFKQCIIFTNSKSNAANLTGALKRLNWPSEFLTSDHDQVSRLLVFNKLKSFKCRILVTTDLTARGIDAENVNLVINVEVPNSHATYLHRIGRAGRFGSYGIAVTLINGCKEVKKFKSILYKVGGEKMSVNILPQDKLPDLWDNKTKFAFEKLFACTFGEVSEETFNDSDSVINCFIGDISDNGGFESRRTSLYSELSSNNSDDKNIKAECYENSENVSKHSSNNGVLQIECFDNLGDDFEEFMKSDSVNHESEQKNHSISNSKNDAILFDKSEISEKLFNGSMKSEFPVEDLNSLMLNFDKCDVTPKLINDTEFDETADDNECVVETTHDFSIPDQVSTDDKLQTIQTNDLNNESKNGIEEKAVVKPIVNDKQLDEDKAFLQAIKTKAITEKTLNTVSDNSLPKVNKALSKSSSPGKDLIGAEFVAKLRAATSDLNEKFIEGNDSEDEDILSKNILRKHKNEDKPMPIVKPKPVNKKQLDEDKAFLEMIKAKSAKAKESNVLVKDSVPDNNKQIVKELKDALKNVECDIFTSPEIAKTKQNRKKSPQMVKDMRKDTTPCKFSSPDKDLNNEEFVDKLRVATSDLNDKFIEGSDNEGDDKNKNILRKHENEEKPTPSIKPKPVSKKQLDEDRAFLEMIKTKTVKEKSPKMMVRDNELKDNEQIVKDLQAAMQNYVDIDTFSSKDGKVITSPEIAESKDIETTVSTPKNLTKGREVLKAFRKCRTQFDTQEIEDVCDTKEIEIVKVESLKGSRAEKIDKINTSVLDVNSESNLVTKSVINTISEDFEKIDINETEKANKDKNIKRITIVNKNALSNGNLPQKFQHDNTLTPRLDQFLSNIDVKLGEVNNFLTNISETDNQNELLQSSLKTNKDDEVLPPMLEQTLINIDGKLSKMNDFLKIITAQSYLDSHSNCDEVQNSSGFVSKISSKKVVNSDIQEEVLDNSANDKTLDDCSSTLPSVSNKENSPILKTSRRNGSSSEFRRNINDTSKELPNASQKLESNNDPMYAHKVWNQNWMQQVWQINNYIAQNNYCRSSYYYE